MKTIKEARVTLEKATTTERSAWARGVAKYALDLLDTVEQWESDSELKIPSNRSDLKKIVLNGADTWHSYSWGGSSLIYNEDIAERLCTPSELKRTRNGERNPNGRETWLDCQARALCQAFFKLARVLEL